MYVCVVLCSVRYVIAPSGLLTLLTLKARTMHIQHLRRRGSAGTSGAHEGNSPPSPLPLYDHGCTPLLLIAPPAILTFLMEYGAVTRAAGDESVCIDRAYVPLSTRQLDPEDGCVRPDSYWNLLQCALTDSDCASHSLPGNPIPGSTPAVGGSDKEYDLVLFSSYYYDTREDAVSQVADPVVSSPEMGGGCDIRTPGFVSQAADPARGKLYREYFQGGVIPAARELLRAAGVLSLVNVKVDHCPQSYGCAITLSPGQGAGQGAGEGPGLKIVYSGDTRPCPRLVALGRGAAVLIHEATFGDNMARDAVEKSHSTVGEAVGVGAAMGAHVTLLTHFSQRYATLPALPALGLGLPAGAPPPVLPPDPSLRLLPVFDYMGLRVRDLLWCTALTPGYYELLSIERDEEEEGAAGGASEGRSSAVARGGSDGSAGAAASGVAGLRLCSCGQLHPPIPGSGGGSSSAPGDGTLWLADMAGYCAVCNSSSVSVSAGAHAVLAGKKRKNG